MSCMLGWQARMRPVPLPLFIATWQSGCVGSILPFVSCQEVLANALSILIKTPLETKSRTDI